MSRTTRHLRATPFKTSNTKKKKKKPRGGPATKRGGGRHADDNQRVFAGDRVRCTLWGDLYFSRRRDGGGRAIGCGTCWRVRLCPLFSRGRPPRELTCWLPQMLAPSAGTRQKVIGKRHYEAGIFCGIYIFRGMRIAAVQKGST